MANVAINGLGRIGRATLKILLGTPGLQLVAVNDLVAPENLAYLLKFDSVYGRFHEKVEHGEGHLRIGGTRYAVLNERDPSKLPWKDLGVDLVFESTGVFTKKEDLQKHLDAGARHVILSAPSKSEDVITVVHGVTDASGTNRMVSCASCTTNCITPVFEIMERRIGVRKATMTSIHAYTSSQSVVDGPSKSVRRGRAAAINLVPTSTGAAKATTKVLPEHEGHFDGVAVRVPVPVGSLADLVFLVERETTVEEVAQIFREEAQTERYKNVLVASDDPLVSSDIIQDDHASIVDLKMIQVVDRDLVKIMSWYDNEWGYAAQMVREAQAMLA
jgi:glyceraldehyde 3-phosphate dehydrogenase